MKQLEDALFKRANNGSTPLDIVDDDDELERILSDQVEELKTITHQ